MAKTYRNGPIYSHGDWGTRLDTPDNAMMQFKPPPSEDYVWHEMQPHQFDLELRIARLNKKDKGFFGWLKRILF